MYSNILMNVTITVLSLGRVMGDEKENSREWWERKKVMGFPMRLLLVPSSQVSTKIPTLHRRWCEWWQVGAGRGWALGPRGGTWKLRGTGGCRCHGSWGGGGERAQKHGKGDGDNPQNPWWRLRTHKTLELGSTVCLQQKAGPGCSWE